MSADPKRPDLAPSPGEVVPIRQGFKSFADRIQGERTRRMALKGKTLGFGVSFLDRALGGIFANDLVIIGAKTGIGKTALSTLIALTNAIGGKHVHYFALEAEEDEIERRLKYSFLLKHMRRRSVDTRWLNFLDWYRGALDHLTGPYEAEVDAHLSSTHKTQHTFYRSSDFYVDHLESMVAEVQRETDLVILDHLHYVDTDEPNENRGYKQIVKRTRDMALRLGKPVVVVAHVRKGDRRSPRLVPDLEDFHGTSDVPKIATKAVMIGPAHGEQSGDPCLWPTYLWPAKCRFDGSRTRYVGLSHFDIRTGMYGDDFELGRLNVTGEEWNVVPAGEWPEWARQGARQ